MVEKTLKRIISGLEPQTDFEKWVIQTPIRVNMNDECFSEVIFYLNDVFGKNLCLADLEADAMDRKIEDRIDIMDD